MTTEKRNEVTDKFEQKEVYTRVTIELIDFTGEDSIFECENSMYW